MDRLICGTTLTGKTEIAIRQSRQQEDKQVAIWHHHDPGPAAYNTFAQRMTFRFVIRMQIPDSVSSRSKDHRDTKKRLVDIVIGTHRVLSDLKFKDLGLLIIDESSVSASSIRKKIKLKENGCIDRRQRRFRGRFV